MLNYHAVITYTNDFEKFVKAVNSIKLMWPKLTIIDNSINKCVKRKYPKEFIYETPVPFTCSQSFNASQTIARNNNADVLIMMHGDMEVTNEKKLQEFLNYLEDLDNSKWGLVWTHYDALVAFNMDCCDVIGPWDQNITHYPIDIDYYYRIKKHGFECLDFGGDWVNHYASSTIRKNMMMDHVNMIHTNECNNSYYRKKWGGIRDKEQYIFPFNGQDLNKQYLNMINDPLHEKLFNGLNNTTEGSFLHGHNEHTRLAQFSLFLNIINAAKPKIILETGTQQFFFTLFLSNFVENFIIYTFDNNDKCLDLKNSIEEDFKPVTIFFKCGDTRETLPILKVKNIDLAWVDGGHIYEVSYSDLCNCGRLAIPYILVDDSRLESVASAIGKFLATHKNYYIINNPYWDYDDRGITILRRER